MRETDRFSLAGKVALILGGSSGIGREIALGFHSAGAIVVPVGKTAAKVAEVEHALAALGGGAKGHAVDVTQPAAAHGVVDDARNRELPVLDALEGEAVVQSGEAVAQARECLQVRPLAAEIGVVPIEERE